MLDFDIEFDRDYAELIEKSVEQERHEISANLAHELTKGIVRPHKTAWPVDTTHSVTRFMLEDDSATHDILVKNTAEYAIYVNTRGRHRGAAQKAVQQLWARALRRVVGN